MTAIAANNFVVNNNDSLNQLLLMHEKRSSEWNSFLNAVPLYACVRKDISLTLAELASSSGLLETRLFTLFHSRVSCQETCCFECRSVFLSVNFAKCSCDAVSESSGLSCETAAVNSSDNIEAAESSCQLERPLDFVLNDILLTEVSVKVSLVDDDVACAREKSHSGYG